MHRGDSDRSAPARLAKLMVDRKVMSSLDIAEALGCLNPSTLVSQATDWMKEHMPCYTISDATYSHMTVNRRKVYMYTLRAAVPPMDEVEVPEPAEMTDGDVVAAATMIGVDRGLPGADRTIQSELFGGRK